MSVLRDFPDLPPVWMLGFAVLAWGVGEVVPIVEFGGPDALGLGIVIAGVGASLAAWAATWFARRRTTIEPREEPSALLVEGPFRINRNPIYTGMALVLVGYAIALGKLSAVLCVLPFAFVIDRRFVRGEEATLQAAFGADADAYMSGTRRW